MPLEAMTAVRDEPGSEGMPERKQMMIEDLPPMPAFRYPSGLGADRDEREQAFDFGDGEVAADETRAHGGGAPEAGPARKDS